MIFKYNIVDKSLTKFEDYNFVNIISSGISKFKDNKIYIDTASVSKDNIVSRDYIINYKQRPSRANMEPIENSSWIAKLKDSPKYILITNYSKEYLNNFILSTGFLGIKSFNRYINNYIFALISSEGFQERKNQISIGATMQGINNDSFKQILVPNLSLEEVEQIGEFLDNIYEEIYNIKKRSLILENIKKNLLEKFFQ